MLVIRREQLTALTAEPRRRFETSLMQHARRYFPQECARADVPAFVRLAIERSRYHGYEAQVETAYYLNLMAMLGSDFDADPQIPWAGVAVDDISVADSRQRLSRVHALALHYLQDIGGPAMVHARRARLRLRSQGMKAVNDVPPRRLNTVLPAILANLYPEKAARDGEPALRALVERATESCQRRGAHANSSVATHTLGLFLLGSGFFGDPLHAWGQALLKQTSMPPDARYDALRDALIEQWE